MSERSGRRGVLIKGVTIVTLLGAGLWARNLTPPDVASGRPGWWPWPSTTIVTLYFVKGPFLFPVSRQLPASADLPRSTLQALLDGPSPDSGLSGAIPPGIEILSLAVSDGVARIDLSAGIPGLADQTNLARTVILATMTALPGVQAVEISADGIPLVARTTRRPLLYYASADGLVAVPTGAGSPKSALDAYLHGPRDPALTALPSDVRLLQYTFDESAGIVSLDFTYTASLRELAIDKPDITRFVLIGLTTSLTEFTDVRAVRIDFEGRSRLGLGQCADLLRVPQPRPRLLNDERLLGT